MRRRSILIAVASIPVSLLLLLLFASTALGSSPSTDPPSPPPAVVVVVDEAPPDSVYTVSALGVQIAGGGTIAGCPPAVHRGPYKVPADGGRAVRTFTGPYIIHAWWNNGHPSVVNKWWNPGVPPWGQELIKFKIPGGVKVEIYGFGGEAWDYVNNRACRHNLRYEFQHGDMPAKSLAQLIELGLARRLN